MQENKYDDAAFFSRYREMPRSREGLTAAGEWHELRKLLPDFTGQRVLDLGCGFGWHCRYAMEHGAAAAVGVDLSARMLEEARTRNGLPGIEYLRLPLEEIDFAADSFDTVISSLALHYVESFLAVCRKVHHCLKSGGDFLFSVEHPVFTAQGPQAWHCDADGKPLHWPVDDYYREGRREAVFLGEPVIKYHKTLTTYVNTLLQEGFALTALVEPQPAPELLDIPGMRDELRRPMMLLVRAGKK